MSNTILHQISNLKFKILISVLYPYFFSFYPIKSFKYFTSKILRSNKILILNEYGIYIYDKNLEAECSLIVFNNEIINSQSELKLVSISQFDLPNYYVICRIKNNIYIVSDENNNNNLIFNATLERKYMAEKLVVIPFKYESDISNNNNIYFIISYIYNKKLCIDKYMITNKKSIELISSVTYDSFICHESGYITCQIMINSSNKEILSCFFQLSGDNFPLMNFVSDPENNFQTISNNTIYGLTLKTILIKSEKNKQKSKSLNCLINEYGQTYCILFDSYANSYSNLVHIYDGCIGDPDSFRIVYSIEKEETSFSCGLSSQKMEMIIFDKDYNIKSNNKDYTNCYYKSDYKDCKNILSYDLVYLNQNNNYYFLYTCEDSGNYTFLNESYGICNNEIDEIYFNNSSPSDSNFTSNVTNSTSDFNNSTLNTTTNTTTGATTITATNKTSNTKSNYNLNNFTLIQFYQEDGILKGKIDIKKEEIVKNLTEIINEIEIGKKYQIIGSDYDIKISPINDQFTEGTKVNFTECENILKKGNNLPEDSKLNILKIEINQENKQILNNKIEYVIFDENKNRLDLSECKNIKIEIRYEINNSTKLNFSMISYYYDQGIDIFNINDSFFNDICYPFSNNKSDVILKDRISDIYQNYSLCEKNCTYDYIEVDSNEIVCQCPVKQEVSTQVDEVEFVDILKMTIVNSNVAVIKCYNLVFTSENKSNNIGFCFFLILLIIQLIEAIYYFIKRQKPVTDFIRNEMVKNNYIIAKSKDKSDPAKKKNHKNEGPKMDVYQMNNKNWNAKHIPINSVTIISSNDIMIDKKNKKVNSNLNGINKCPSRNKIKSKTSKKDISNKNQEKNSRNKTIADNDKDPKNNESQKSIDINNSSGISKCPGYYHLILINAKNLTKIKSNNSKYILNIYTFKEATKNDMRGVWRITWICLLNTENILKTFVFKSVVELKSLRIILFIFTYSFYLTLNALFYGNNKISDNYHYDGDYLYLYSSVNNLVISISSGIAGIILILLENLIHSRYELEEIFRAQEKNMKKYKKYEVNEKQLEKIKTQINKTMKKLKIKNIIFLSINFVFMMFFFYFITAFCAVYHETQISWILNAIISFIVSIIIEFIIAFTNAIIYETSVRYKIESLFKISLFVYKYT